MTEETLREPTLLSPEGLKELAIAFAAGRVFTDHHIASTDGHLFGSIFMPIGLGCLAGMSIEKIGLVFEYLEKAGPRGINGYPVFMSVNLLHINQLPELKDMVDRINAAVESV